MNGLDFVSQRVAISEECQKKGLELKEKIRLKMKREEPKAKEASNYESEIAMQ